MKGLNVNNTPDYKSYTLQELHDSLKYIDKQNNSENASCLEQEIQSRMRGNDTQTSIQTDDLQSSNYITPKGNWFKLHWTGQLPLVYSYWINVFGIGVALYYVSAKFFEFFIYSDASGSQRGLTLLFFYGFITSITVWQLVGLYRSADKHVIRGGDQGWAVVAKIIVLIGVCRFCYDMSQTGIPTLIESGSMITGKSGLPPHFIRIMNNGTEVELNGGIEFGVSSELLLVLEANPKIKIIHLNSLGGRISEAIKLAALVSKYQLTTYTKTRCLSACPIVFLAGKEKLLGHEAQLGFHSASVGNASGSEVKELNKELIAELKKAKVANWLIKKATTINAENIWNPTNQELLKAKVVDRVVNSNYYALSGVADWQNPQDIRATLKRNELYNAMSEFDVEGFSFVHDSLFKGIQTGLTLQAIDTTIENYLYPNRIRHYLRNGADAEVIQYMHSQIKQMIFLQNDYPNKCASYLYSHMFAADILDDLSIVLPAELIEVETNATIALVKSISSDQENAQEAQLKELISIVVSKVISMDESIGIVFANPDKYMDQPDKLCSATLLFNQQVILLPAAQAAFLTKGIYAND